MILSAPAKDELDATIVLGVNDQILNTSHRIISNASCTTNCLAPMAKVLHEAVRHREGPDDDDPRLHQRPARRRPGPRRPLSRPAAAVNIIPSKTGAAKAVGEVIPELKGKLTGFALRVPVPDGSVTDLTALSRSRRAEDEVNGAMKAAAEGPAQGHPRIRHRPAGLQRHRRQSAFLHLRARPDPGHRRQPRQGRSGWYDNEWGYSNRTAELITKLGSL